MLLNSISDRVVTSANSTDTDADVIKLVSSLVYELVEKGLVLFL